MDPAILSEVHHFWFGDLAGPDAIPVERVPMWFEQKDSTDNLIRDAYGHLLDPVAKTEWDLDALSRQEAMGLIVFLDQFPRNLFRGSGEAFAYDPKALAIARHLVARRLEDFYLIERSFLFLPYEHSESLADQDESVRLYEGLAAAMPADKAPGGENFLSFAEKHRVLIRRFGRFPHRNAMLGRQSTREEEAFLAEHGRGF